MKSYRKMMLVTPDEYNRMKQPDTIDKSIDENKHLPDDQREKMDQLAISEHRKKQAQVEPSLVPDNLIQGLPRNAQSRARGLIGFLKDTRRVEWNDRGEIRPKDGNFITGSNIIDLIQHSVRDSRRQISPRGWNEFFDQIKKSNVPRSLLGNATLYELNPEGRPAPQARIPPVYATPLRAPRIPWVDL